VQCPETLRVQAYFDGELDAVTASDIERHLEHCAECHTLHQELGELRVALRRDLPYEQTPPALRARVMRALNGEPADDTHRPRFGRTSWLTRQFWVGVTSGLGTAAAAVMLAFWFSAPLATNPTVDALLGAHVNSLLSTHLIDVASSDHHTVKPWFAGHTDVSPVVADFAAQGYPLVGGRVAYVEHQRAAVVVYRHGAHVVNVFSWAATAQSLPTELTRDGYHMVFWKVGDLQYCAVSDTGWDELRGLVRLLEDLGAADSRS
jgi:anti-sigma factor RsiW